MIDAQHCRCIFAGLGLITLLLALTYYPVLLWRRVMICSSLDILNGCLHNLQQTF